MKTERRNGGSIIGIDNVAILSEDIVAMALIKNLSGFRVWLRTHEDPFLFSFDTPEAADRAYATAFSDWRDA